MTNILPVVLLISSLIPISASPIPQPIVKEVEVIFVQPEVNFLPVDHEKALSALEKGLNFWEELAPITTTFEITSVTTITTTALMREDLSWSFQYEDPPRLTIFVIETSDPIRDCCFGLSWNDLIWAQAGENDFFSGTIAHEVGHSVFGLGHHYEDPLDLMGWNPQFNIERWFLGCSTGEDLGKPCFKTYLPQGI